MSDKHKFVSPSAIQVKNQWRIISTSIEEKLDVQSDLKKVNELLTFAIMLDSFRVAHVQIMITKELKKVLSQKLKRLFV